MFFKQKPAGGNIPTKKRRIVSVCQFDDVTILRLYAFVNLFMESDTVS